MVKGGEEAAHHEALEIVFESLWVRRTRAVGSRVTFAAESLEGAANPAVCKCTCRVQGVVGGSFAVAGGDLIVVVNLTCWVSRV